MNTKRCRDCDMVIDGDVYDVCPICNANTSKMAPAPSTSKNINEAMSFNNGFWRTIVPESVELMNEELRRNPGRSIV